MSLRKRIALYWTGTYVLRLLENWWNWKRGREGAVLGRGGEEEEKEEEEEKDDSIGCVDMRN